MLELPIMKESDREVLGRLLSAGYIMPDTEEIYIVALVDEKNSLKLGDVVALRTFGAKFCFVRLTDSTVHNTYMTDDTGYIWVFKYDAAAR